MIFIRVPPFPRIRQGKGGKPILHPQKIDRPIGNQYDTGDGKGHDADGNHPFKGAEKFLLVLFSCPEVNADAGGKQEGGDDNIFPACGV